MRQHETALPAATFLGRVMCECVLWVKQDCQQQSHLYHPPSNKTVNKVGASVLFNLVHGAQLCHGKRMVEATCSKPDALDASRVAHSLQPCKR